MYLSIHSFIHSFIHFTKLESSARKRLHFTTMNEPAAYISCSTLTLGLRFAFTWLDGSTIACS